MLMADAVIDLLKAHFRQLRLPTMGQEFERLARDAAATNQNYFQFLLRLAETELATRAANTVTTRIKNAEFPVLKDFETFDFTILPQLSKPKVLELARCEWIEHKYNCCLVGSHGTGKTHIAIALGQAACRQGLRVRFFTAADLVTELEKAQKHYTLDRLLGQLERVHLLICDELGESVRWSASGWRRDRLRSFPCRGPQPRPGDHAMPRGHILDLRWNALLNDFRRSGLTQAEFCERRGISIHSFRKRP
jgi:DNA replication protein DnaC